MSINLRELLEEMVRQDASDLYITVDSPPMYRVEGVTFPWGERKYSPEETETMSMSLMSETRRWRWRRDSSSISLHGTWDLIPLRIHTLHIGIVVSPLDFPSGSRGRASCHCGSPNGTACSANCKTGTKLASSSTNRSTQSCP